MSGFFSLGGQVPATGTNDDAAAGKVGEMISSSVVSGSAISLSTTTDKTVTSISLTAGDWDVSGTVYFIGAAGTTITICIGSISSTDNAKDTTAGKFGILFGSGVTQFSGGGFLTIETPSIPSFRLSLAATTTIYLVAYGDFGVSTLKAYGRISARRIR